MSRELETLTRTKANLEREKAAAKAAVADFRAELEVKERLRVGSERLARDLEKQMAESAARLETASEQIIELSGVKARLGHDLANLRVQCDELEGEAACLGQAKLELGGLLEEARRGLDEERRYKGQLSSQVGVFFLSQVSHVFFPYILY